MKNEQCCVVIVATLAILMIAGTAAAQTFPSRPVRLIVPFAAGGTIDIIARVLSPHLTKALGQNVLVDDRPGGGTAVGTDLVARSPADGHTILLIGPSFTINLYAREKLPYDTVRDFTGVARLAMNPLLLSVHPTVPVKSVRELIALARSRPGELTYATASPTGSQRLAGEKFRAMAKVDILNVPYSGGAPASVAVMGGHTTILLGNVSEAAPFVAQGRLRPIAVTSLTRSDVMKDVPTLHESGLTGYEVINWFGAVTRSSAPPAAIERMSAEFARALEVQEVKERLASLGLSAATLKVGEFNAFLKSEMQSNEKIVRAANIRM